MSFRDQEKTALRDLLEAQGEDGATRIIEEAIATKKLRPEDFSLREIWDACTGGANIHEAVASSSFPKITGALINAKIIAGYEGVQKIGDMLCETVPSNMQRETIAGVTGTETPDEVGEGQEYNDSTLTEKWVTADNVKYGRLISVTEETIKFDKLGQILARAKTIGEGAAQWREKLIVEGVQDINSTVYNPSGVPTALYATAFNNLVATNPFGESGLEAVLKQLQLMKSDAIGATDDDYIGITITDPMVLVPSDLQVEAWQMANSAKTPESGENAENFFKGRFKVLSSPYVTAQSATTWYYGDPRRQFWWLEVFPLQVMTQKPGHEDEFRRDIKSRTKVRFMGSVACLDTRYFIKCTA